MSVYKKLAEARARLQAVVIAKSGRNEFSRFNYFELSDFLPHVNSLNKEVGIVSVVNFTEGQATLEIIDVDDDSRIVFTTPTSKLALKNASEIQQIGAMHTYFRRYLYLLAYEICEHDVVDMAPQEDPVSDEEIAKAIQSLSTATTADDLTFKHASLAEKVRFHEEVVGFFNNRLERLKTAPGVNVTKLLMGSTPVNAGAHPSTLELPLDLG